MFNFLKKSQQSVFFEYIRLNNFTEFKKLELFEYFEKYMYILASFYILYCDTESHPNSEFMKYISDRSSLGNEMSRMDINKALSWLQENQNTDVYNKIYKILSII